MGTCEDFLASLLVGGEVLTSTEWPGETAQAAAGGELRRVAPEEPALSLPCFQVPLFAYNFFKEEKDRNRAAPLLPIIGKSTSRPIPTIRACFNYICRTCNRALSLRSCLGFVHPPQNGSFSPLSIFFLAR